MLDGESIELSRSDVPLAERDLLGSSEITVRCTAEQLLERMSDAFDEVKTVVARFGDAWDALTPRVNAAQTALDEVQSLAAGLGDHHRRDLDDAARAVARLATSASADPLSTAPGDLDPLIDSLREIRRDLDATSALRREFDARIADARSLLASLETTAGDGTGRARGGAGEDLGPHRGRAGRAAGSSVARSSTRSPISPAREHGGMPGSSWTRGHRAPMHCSTRPGKPCEPTGPRSRRAISSEPCSRPTR